MNIKKSNLNPSPNMFTSLWYLLFSKKYKVIEMVFKKYIKQVVFIVLLHDRPKKGDSDYFHSLIYYIFY